MKIKTAIISSLFIPLFVFAQNGAALPNAGLTPESPFYFLDRLGEALRELFTFSPEGKARLQVEFAAERVAEIKIILETKGVDAKGLEVAQARLREHLGEAAEIVIKQKNKGKDVSSLAKELDDDFEEPKFILAESFEAEKEELKTKKDDLKGKLKAAIKAGDSALVETLSQELGRVKAQLELLELKEEELEDDLDEEEKKLENELDAREEAEEAIREAKEERAETVKEVKKENLKLPANAFATFDELLTQAESAHKAGNHQEAERLAEQAEDSIDDVEDIIEDLEEIKEEQEDEEDDDVNGDKEENEEENNEDEDKGEDNENENKDEGEDKE
ncbi:MAG: hypothetical protein AAB340_02035 [Patescibacteria group bacterium]